MKKAALLLLLTSLVACNPSASKDGGSYGFFKQYVDIVNSDDTKEYSFFTLYDGESNRFELSFNYGLHFFYEIMITEYDILDYYHYASEGTFSEDYETATFTLDARSDSELFPDGKYVLSHKTVNNKDAFELSVNGKIIQLTSESKTRPTYISDDFVGNFEYLVNDDVKFNIATSVGALKDGRPVSISLNEGDVSFTCNNIEIKSASVSFTVNGNADGEYIKRGPAVLTKNSKDVVLKIDNKTYPLTLNNKQEVSYFNDENNNSTFSNEYVSITLGNMVGSEYRFVKLSELQEGGKKDSQILFKIIDNGEAVVNSQVLNGTLIFTAGSQVKIVHSSKQGKDQIDLYKNSELLYSNLTISNN